MSTASAYTIDYGKPRTIWTIVLQLFYSIIAMIPFYYYLREIVQLQEEGRFLLQFLPVVTGILLFFIQININEYFWKQEKIYKNRDIFQSAIKSAILVISMFYVIFLLIFSRWIGIEGIRALLGFQDDITIILINLSLSLLIIAGTMVMMIAIQNDKLAGRKIGSRFRR